MIRILLAEDQAMVRGALSALLNLESDIEVIGTAADGEIAWRELQRLKPDLLLTDIEMPGLSGLDLAQRIQRHNEFAQIGKAGGFLVFGALCSCLHGLVSCGGSISSRSERCRLRRA